MEIESNEKIRYKDENDLDAGVVVLYRGKAYTTGNRYKGLVELYAKNKFRRTAKISEVHSFLYSRICFGHGKFGKHFTTTAPGEHFCKECRAALDKLVDTFNRCSQNLNGSQL
jgi:hypothetical protein